MKPHTTDLPAELAAAQQQFARWRAAHKPRTRFPEPLWQLAVTLSRQYGHHRVCKALQLDYYSLKKRLSPEPARSQPRSGPAFVELLPEKSGPSAGCTIEYENAHGCRIRIQLDGRDLSELRTFCRELWSDLR